jgi:pilus assembly protein FimV
MSRKLIVPAVLSLFLAPGAALSLGLGDIRLNSYLNQPLSAEIGLSAASPEELETLRVEVAPAETFRRYGLERPAYLDDLRFQVRRDGANSAVVQVSSPQAITEPFVTFLVEARWSGGRILREYTVLLDPPTFLPAREAGVAPAAPVDAPRPAPVVRAEPAPAPAPAATPSASPAPSPVPVEAPTPVRVAEQQATELGPVQRNETLWAIAQRVRPDDQLSTNQVMVALFRSNPHAFDGNINRLRAGSILRVPSRDEMAAASSGEATAEVRRQEESWRTAVAPAAAPVQRRLELAPPSEAPARMAPASTLAGEGADAAAAMRDDMQQLRGELAEVRRLVELRDAEIAALQARLSQIGVESPVIEAPEAAPISGVTADETTPAAEPVAAEPAVATPAPAPAAPAPSLIERVLAMLGALWLWLLLAGVLLAAAVVLFLRKRREDDGSSIEADLAETGTWGALPAAGATLPARNVPAARPGNFEAILVEESAPPPVAEPPAARPVTPPPRPVPVAAPVADLDGDDEYQYPFEDTIAGETGVSLDQTDPMAEADFHMAYGLYDQAAEIIRKAIQREPERYDLRRKLLDICFVWGNADEFRAQAEALRDLGGQDHPSDWAKISIMGRQICPSEPIFAEGAAPGVDIDFGGESMVLPALDLDTSASGEWLDFDVGESDDADVALGDTQEQPAPGARRPIDQTAELDLEELGIDLDLGESGEHALQDLATFLPDAFPVPDDVEPAVAVVTADEDEEEDEKSGGTLVMNVKFPGDGDATLGGQVPALAADDPTLSGLTGINESGFVIDETRLERAATPGDDDAPTMTGLGALDDDDDEQTFIKKLAASDESPTAELAFDRELDLDLDDLTQALEADLTAYQEVAFGNEATQLAPRIDSAETAHGDDDATVMAPRLASAEYAATLLSPRIGTEDEAPCDIGDTRQMPSPEVDEVATKLDLARAYIDMGDPEGARSILEEVVDEGNEAQREEARELIDGLS